MGFEGWSNKTLLQAVYVDTQLSATMFTHLVLTHDGSVARLYWNGNAVNASKAATLGETAEPATWGNGFIGSLDELAIYDKPLSATRVKAHYQAAPGQ